MKLRRLLFPLSLLYGLINECRNLLFRLDILKKYNLPATVISVGNLCAGGTGKTPFVMALIEFLSPNYSHIAVISRGYGRTSKGARIISLIGNLRSNLDDSGDEPYIIAKRFPTISVVVSEKRIEGYQLLLSQSKKSIPDLIILDDGFQHQYIERDLNICLMNGYEPYENDMILPAGNLREFKYNLNRADCLIETKHKSNSRLSDLPYFFVDYKPPTLSEKLSEKPISLISGIAKPRHFEELINQRNIKYKEHYKFSDHQNYSLSNFSELDETHQIITTEKDYYKLKQLGLKNKIVYLKLDFTFSEELKQFISKQL